MGLQLQSGSSGTPALELVTVVLSGYRNDLARHRVLSFVEKQCGVAAADIVLPFTVLAQAASDAGARLADELQRLGAMVIVTRVAPISATTPSVPEDVVQAVPPAPESPPSIWEFPPLRFLRLVFAALRIPMLVCAGLALFSLFRLWIINRNNEEMARAMHIAGMVPAAEQFAMLEKMQDIWRADEAQRAAEPRRAAEAPVPAAPSGINTIKGKLASDPAGALRAIQEALTLNEDPALLALQGDAYVKMSNWDAARISYERAVTRGTHDGRVYLALSGIYRQQGEQDAAVDMLHRAKENGATGVEFEALVRMIKGEQDAESKFGAESSPHFTISFDRGEDHAEAQRILAQLENAYSTVGQKLDSYPRSRIPAVTYAARDFQDVTHAPGWAGALYDGRIKVPVRGTRRQASDLAGTIRHEYTHALINTIAGSRCPVWLNEGVAMWAEEERDGEREKWALGAIQLDNSLSLKQLEGSFASLSGRRAIAAYAQSYLAVRHIVSRYGQLPLRKLLEAFTTAGTTADAFRDALDVDLAVFEQDLQSDQGDA